MDSEYKSFIKIFITGCLWGTIGLFVKLMEAQGSSSPYTSFLRLLSGFILLAFMTLIIDGPKAFCIGRRTLLFKEKLNLLKWVALLVNVIGCALTATGGDFSPALLAPPGTFDRRWCRLHLCDDPCDWKDCHAGESIPFCRGCL